MTSHYRRDIGDILDDWKNRGNIVDQVITCDQVVQSLLAFAGKVSKLSRVYVECEGLVYEGLMHVIWDVEDAQLVDWGCLVVHNVVVVRYQTLQASEFRFHNIL